MESANSIEPTVEEQDQDAASVLAVPPVDLVPLSPELYINRELSWLEFNRRVLDEVAETANPLLERVKFAAIFTANLDEFFMIRVAGVRRKVMAGITDVATCGRTPAQQHSAIRAATQELLDEHARLLRDELIPTLASNRVSVVPYSDLRKEEKAFLGEVFEREIYPMLTPQAVDRGRRFPHVSNDSLNLIVLLQSGGQPRFARVKVPGLIPRLLPIPGELAARAGTILANPNVWLDEGGARFTWAEDVVAAHLDRLFPGSEVLAAYPFHLVRDSDVEPDEDDDDQANMLEAMRETLAQRPFGSVVRLDVDTAMPGQVLEWLVDQVHANSSDVYVIDGRLCVDHLFALTRLDLPALKDPPLAQSGLFGAASQSDGETCDGCDIFDLVRQKDVLVHLPYQSFNIVADFVHAAATDPNVVAIKQTLYRVGKDSPLIPSLIQARDDDTQVAVLVEIKARFDEENNISWAQTLEQAGVHVAYGLLGLKTHCKVTLVVRREQDGLRRYVHIATGNYNANTARVYEDIGILTSREDIAEDVSRLFNYLTGFAPEIDYDVLWTAPARMRRQIVEAILAEVREHERTGQGHLIFKMNSLVDKEVIRALYTASRAGVKIDLIIRGICCLRPGVPGFSETVRVVSLVGRFLEHSRIYYFNNGGKPKVYIGSADAMERNFDRRVEVITPVDSPELVSHLHDVVLDAYLRDTANTRVLERDGTYRKLRPEKRRKPFDAQQFFLDYYRKGSPVGAHLTGEPVSAGSTG